MRTPDTARIKSSLLALTLGTALCLPLSAANEKPAAEGAPKVEKKVEPKRQEKKHPRPPRRANPKPVKPAIRLEPKAETGREKTVKRTWLGVSMAPVPGALREHLELTEGFGIQVQSVVGDSPAKKAGLRNNDILTRLDDQILTTPEHLAILIRSKKTGDKVTLGFIRKGKDQTLDLTLGEREMPAGPVVGSNFHHRPQHFQIHSGPQMPPYMRSKEWQEAMKRHQDQWRKRVEKGQTNQSAEKAPFSCPMGQQGQGQKKGSSPNCPLLDSPPKAGACPKCPLKKSQNRTTGKPPAISVRPGFPLKIFGTVGIVKIDNEEGELTLTQDGDSYAMVIKDKDGKEVFSGPYDTEKGVAALPKEAKVHLKKMKLEDLDVMLPKNDLKINISPEREGSSRKKDTNPGDIL